MHVDLLIQEQFDGVWRFARRRCATAADADDVTAETFSIVWRKRHELPPDQEVRPWLFGIVRRVVANHRRAEVRRSRLHQRIAERESRQPSECPPFDEGDRTVWAALARLPERDRDLLLMKAWDGLDIADIAMTLGCSRNAVSVRMHRARRRLETALDQELDERPKGDEHEEAADGCGR